jgi:hypothetical protein
MVIEAVATAGVDTGRRLVEIERIRAWVGWDRARSAGDIERAVEASRMQERFDVLFHGGVCSLFRAG